MFGAHSTFTCSISIEKAKIFISFLQGIQSGIKELSKILLLVTVASFPPSVFLTVGKYENLGQCFPVMYK